MPDTRAPLPETWKRVKLGEVTRAAIGGTPSRKRPDYWNGAIPWLTTSTIDFGRIRKADEYITEAGLKNSSARIFPKGTVVMAMFGQGATRGKVARLGIAAAFNQACVALTPRNGDSPAFIYQVLAHHYEQLRALSNTGSQANLNAALIKSFEIPLPGLTEQRRIATVAGAWDRAVSRTTRLLNAKRRLRHGLMQQLLTGKRRFADFPSSSAVRSTPFGSIPSDWSYVRIGDIAGEITERGDDDVALPVLSCTKRGGFVESLRYFGKQVFSANRSNYRLVHRGQFAFPTNHVEEGSIGLLTTHAAGLVSPIYTVFETNEQVDRAFLFLLLKTELYRHIFKINTNSSVDRRGSLRWNQFAKIRVPLPTLAEQQKIAEAFTTLDREIELLRQQVVALKQQKQALMQKLLTGQVRVPV